ncbi:MAG: VanZ family protein [bacterium]
MRLTYGSRREKTLLPAAFLAAAAAGLALLLGEGLDLLPFLWLPLYLAGSGLLLGALSVRPLRDSAFGNLLYRALPTLLIAGAILTASSLPMGPGKAVSVPDDLLHGLEYAGLGFLMARMLHPAAAPLRLRALVLAGAIAVLFGALDEFRQSFVPGRDPSLADLRSDAVGILAGVLSYTLLYLRRAEGPD